MDIKEKINARLESIETVPAEQPKQDERFSLDHVLKCHEDNVEGDARIFKEIFRDDFVYNKSMDVWLFWDGHHWCVDKHDHALAAVSQVAEVYANAANQAFKLMKDTDEDDPCRKSLKTQYQNLKKRAFVLKDVPRATRCLTLAHSSHDPLAITGDEIDQQPYLLACRNCVVNLETGEPEAGRQKDYLLKSSPVEWQGIDAPCPVWEAALNDIFAEDQALIDFVRRVLGYAMIGKVLLSKLIVMVGRGRNGKTIIMETVSRVLGELAGAIRPEMLLDQGRITNPSGPSPEIMAMRGARVLVASETDENCRISTARAKWLTGDDTLVARGPHDKYEVQFKPSHTLFLLTNHKPHVSADDYAFWKRVILIPFNVSFVDEKPQEEFERQADPYLADKLEDELPGILAWMVRGCIEWQNSGLCQPGIVKDAVSQYQKDEDSIGDFLEQCCVIGPDFTVTAAAIYEVFAEWWKLNISNRIPKQKRFGTLLGRRFEKKKMPNVTYLGVGLLSDDELPFSFN